MKAYRITQWDESHETHESRKLKYLAWVAVPNKHDGLGFSNLKTQDNRVELYCAFCLMVQLAGKGQRGWRGWLARDGRGLEARDMALMTGFPQEIFERAVKFFSLPEMGWMVLEEMPEVTGELPLAAKNPARSAGPPGDSAGIPARSAGPPGDSAEGPAKSPGGDRQTVQTDRQTDSSLSRARGATESDSPPPDPEPVIPTLAEVQDFCNGAAAVPLEYGERFFDKKKTAPAMWLDARGNLIDWRHQLMSWWKADRAKWQPAASGGKRDGEKRDADARRGERRGREFEERLSAPSR